MRRLHQRRNGYVLVMTLAIIALATISLAGFARASLTTAVSARQRAEDLQRHWGVVSVRHVLLDRADEILQAKVPVQEANSPPWPKPAHVQASFSLGGQGFQVIFADEDAKADLNTIHRRKRERTLSAIRKLYREPDLEARLRPGTEGTAYASWGQVFELAGDSTGDVDDLCLVGRDMTCWGSGKLNLRRASDAAVRETLELVLPAQKAEQIVQARKNWGGQSFEALLDDLKLRRSEIASVKRLLTDQSRCHSLWVRVDNGQRDWWYQFIDNGKLRTFAW